MKKEEEKGLQTAFVELNLIFFHVNYLDTLEWMSVFLVQHHRHLGTNIAIILYRMVTMICAWLCSQTCSTKILEKEKKPGNSFRINYILRMSLIMVRMQN